MALRPLTTVALPRTSVLRRLLLAAVLGGVLVLVLSLLPDHWLTFAWVSVLGMAPVMAVYVNAGTRLGEVSAPAGLLSPPVLGSLVVLGVFPLLAKRGLEACRRRRAQKAPRGSIETL